MIGGYTEDGMSYPEDGKKRRPVRRTWPYITVCVLALAVAAQPPKKTIWDGVYTKEQAQRGRAAYTEACSYCHGPGLTGGEVAGELAPDLKGIYFILRWSGSLSDLFIKIDDSMPKDDPGAVSSEDTADIIAYLLQSNQAQAGESEIRSDREKVKDILVTKKPN
jgi:mono/diheme cytochrome c family protein